MQVVGEQTSSWCSFTAAIRRAARKRSEEEEEEEEELRSADPPLTFITAAVWRTGRPLMMIHGPAEGAGRTGPGGPDREDRAGRTGAPPQHQRVSLSCVLQQPK